MMLRPRGGNFFFFFPFFSRSRCNYLFKRARAALFLTFIVFTINFAVKLSSLVFKMQFYAVS